MQRLVALIRSAWDVVVRAARGRFLREVAARVLPMMADPMAGAAAGRSRAGRRAIRLFWG